MCGCPTGAVDPDVSAVSGTSTSANRCDEPVRHAPGAPAAAGDGTDGPPMYGNQSSPAATSNRGSDDGPTSPSGRVSSQLGPGRGGPDPQPIQASGITMSAQPSASTSPSGAYSGCCPVAAFSSRSAASWTSDAGMPGNGSKTGGSIRILPSTRLTRAEPNGPATGSSSDSSQVTTVPDWPAIGRAASGTALGPGMGTDRQPSEGSMIRSPVSVATTASLRPSPSTSSTSGLLGHGFAAAVSTFEVARSTRTAPSLSPMTTR